MAYSKQTWDTTSYVNPTRMNHIEDGIASADMTGGGTVNGNLVVGRTTSEDSYLVVGSSTSKGIVDLSNNSKVVGLEADSLTANRVVKFPNKSGTVAMTSDLLYPANTVIKAVGQVVNFNNSSLFGVFVPLENADKYNISFTSQKEMGTSRSATFGDSLFTKEISKNGFWFYSSDANVRYWFFDLGRTDTQYEFSFTISPL